MPTHTKPSDRADWQAWLAMAFAASKLLPCSVGSPARLVRRWAERNPHSLAIAFEDRRVSWRELDTEADRFARWLQNEGLRAGDVIALMMDNRPEFLVLFTAISRIGAVATLINTQLQKQGLEHALKVSEAKLVICGSEHAATVLEGAAGLRNIVPNKNLVIQRDRTFAETHSMRAIDDELDSADGQAMVRDVAARNSDLCCYVYSHPVRRTGRRARSQARDAARSHALYCTS